MGIICSSVPEIDDLYFKELPSSRPVKIEKVVRIGRTFVMKAENGTLYSNSVGRFAYLPGKWPWVEDVMKALVKLKVITPVQMKAHLDHCNRNDMRKKKEYALADMKRLSKEFGIKFTKKQMSILEN